MRVELRLSAPEDAASLLRWLSAEAPAAAHVGYAETGDQAGQGTAVDVIAVVLSSVFSAAQLALAIAQWRMSRPGRPKVSIEHRAADGSVTVIESTDPEALAAAIRSIEN